MNKDRTPLVLVERAQDAHEEPKAPGQGVEHEAGAEVAQMRRAVADQAHELRSTLARDADGADTQTQAALQALVRETDQVQADFVAEAAPRMEAVVEEPMHRLRETYMGPDGRPLCEFDMGLDEDGKGRLQLRKLLVRSPEGQEVDIMSLANRGNWPIRVNSGSLNFMFSPPQPEADDPDERRGYVTCPVPKSPHSLGILLHELGHAEQFDDPSFRAIAEGYVRETPPERLRELAQRDPDFAKLLDESVIQEFEVALRQAAVAEEAARAAREKADAARAEQDGEHQRIVTELLEKKGLTEGRISALLDEQGRADREAWRPGLTQSQRTEQLELSEQHVMQQLRSFGFQFPDEDPDISVLQGRAKSGDVPELSARFAARVGYDIDRTLSKGADPRDVRLRGAEERPDGSTLPPRLELMVRVRPHVYRSAISLSGLETDLEAAQKRLKPLEERSAQAELEAAQAEVVKKEAVRSSNDAQRRYADMSMLTTRILERNATARAFLWMRKLKKDTGIDLLGTTKNEGRKEDKPDGSDACENAMPDEEVLDPAEVEAHPGAYGGLQWALGTYGARTGEMRKAYGKVPSPRRPVDP